MRNLPRPYDATSDAIPHTKAAWSTSMLWCGQGQATSPCPRVAGGGPWWRSQSLLERLPLSPDLECPSLACLLDGCNRKGGRHCESAWQRHVALATRVLWREGPQSRWIHGCTVMWILDEEAHGAAIDLTVDGIVEIGGKPRRHCGGRSLRCLVGEGRCVRDGHAEGNYKPWLWGRGEGAETPVGRPTPRAAALAGRMGMVESCA